MIEKVIDHIKKLQKEQDTLYVKYNEGEATKQDIKRIDEITNELLELRNDG